MIEAILGFAAVFVVHVIVWRIFPSNSPRIKLLFLVLLAGNLITTALIYYGFEQNFQRAFDVFCISVGIDAIYLYIYSGVCRSVSLTLLGQLTHTRHSMPLKDFVTDYEESDRFEDRVKVMEEAGFVSIQGNEVVLTFKGQNAARWIERISNIISGGLEG